MPRNPFAAMESLNKQDGFEPTETDHQIAAAHGTQMTEEAITMRRGAIQSSRAIKPDVDLDKMLDLSFVRYAQEILGRYER